jgi:hypothetical protein
MSGTIQERISRLYAAMGAIEESRPTNVRARVYRSEKGVIVVQDFRGGKSDAQLMNDATMLIYSVANLDTHLKHWAEKNGVGKAKIDHVFSGSQELKIIKDLSNNDRHPYPPRNGGHSGLSPRLVD